ncbi:hypothetical protein CHCC14819_0455 [Bacillus licheniformis]|uniref:DUF7448 domain-containing protein n=1 Tax=Bacillus licheniformis TaxID=1402 RepID=UPI0011A5944A|nr:hypothetical protein [Bacillus licheniformis]TWM32259.1 hypothetical protein CHCC14819_0455 [Bacillus licheniformis]
MGFNRWSWEDESIEVLKGKVLTEISVSEAEDEIYFTTAEGEEFLMYHNQDCCETVEIEEIIGDIEDLLGSPILMAEEITEDATWDSESWGSATWTFYKLATIKGYVTIRWYGSSNGYYSESVDFVRVPKDSNE